MVGRQPLTGEFQERFTFEPLTEKFRLVGALGALLHGPGPPPPPTIIVTSFDGPLVPAEFLARRRTKYVPAGTDVAWNPAAVDPVSKTRISLEPGPEPASITYDVG